MRQLLLREAEFRSARGPAGCAGAKKPSTGCIGDRVSQPLTSLDSS